MTPSSAVARRISLRLVAVIVVLVATFQGTAGAAFKSAPSTSHHVTGRTLLAATLSCSATGTGLLGAVVHLTWVATADATTVDHYGSGFAIDGYEIDSATASGGPYSTVVATVSRLATSYNDAAPAAGISYYVIRPTKQLWRSTNSNQVTASVQLLSATCA